MIKRNFDDCLNRFQETVCFLTFNSICQHYKSIDEYRHASDGDKAYKLHISRDYIKRLSLVNQKKCLKEFLEKSTDLFKYHKHCHKIHKSKKKFNRHSWFELSDSVLEKYENEYTQLPNENKENKLILTSNKLISKDTKQFLENVIYLDYFLKKNLNKIPNELRNELLNELTQIENEITMKQKEKEQHKSDKSMVKQLNNEIKKLKNQHIKMKKEIREYILQVIQNDKVINEQNEQIKEQQEQIKELKSHNKELESQLAHTNNKDKNSDIPVDEQIKEPVKEEEHLIEYDELDKYFPDEIEQSDFDRLSDDCKQKIKEKAEKENLEFEKNIFENCSSEKRQTEITNAEKLLANFDNEMKDFDEDIEEIVEEKPIQKPIQQPIEEKPDNKNSDIPSCIEDRFQEFINKKYIGPAEATTLWCGLNEYAAHNPPKFKANGYIPCERNTIKNENGVTPQQIIAVHIINQMQQQHIEIKDEKLKARFYKTLNNMVA